MVPLFRPSVVQPLPHKRHAKIIDIAGATLFGFPNDHPPPYIHVRYLSKAVRLRTLDAVSMAPQREFPVRVLRDAQDWLSANQDQAIEIWDIFHS
jgi:hypothetical protein